MMELYILGALVLAWACAPHKGKGKRQARRREPIRAAKRPRTVRESSSRANVKVLNLAQLETMESQINAACELGIALDRKAREQTDPVKRARLAQQSANAYARAANIQARIDKMMLAS